MFQRYAKTSGWVLALGLILAGFIGCRPATIILPPHIHSIGLAVVGNQTSQYGLEALCTQAVLRQLQADGRFPLDSDLKADLVVKMVIRQYQREILLTDPTTNRPQQYRLSIQYDLTATDQIDQRPLFEDKGRVRSVLYYTADYPGAIVETEDQALTRLSEDLATSLVRRVIEGL
jgi:hypothetical protein